MELHAPLARSSPTHGPRPGPHRPLLRFGGWCQSDLSRCAEPGQPGLRSALRWRQPRPLPGSQQRCHSGQQWPGPLGRAGGGPSGSMPSCKEGAGPPRCSGGWALAAGMQASWGAAEGRRQGCKCKRGGGCSRRVPPGASAAASAACSRLWLWLWQASARSNVNSRALAARPLLEQQQGDQPSCRNLSRRRRRAP